MEPTVETITSFGNTFGTVGTIIILVLILGYLIWKEILRQKSHNKRNKDDQDVFTFIEQGTSAMESIKDYLELATKQYSEEVTKSQALILIEKLYILSEKRIILYGLEIINNNNIKTRQAEIRSKVELYVKNLYAEQGNALNEFKYKKHRLEKTLDYEQAYEVSNAVIDIILEGKEPRVLASYCENTFKAFINKSKTDINEY